MASSIKKAVDTGDRVDQVAVMRGRGYILATEVAAKLGINPATVTRWATLGEVDSELLTGKRYIKLSSLVGSVHLSHEQAIAFGFVETNKKDRRSQS